MPNEPKNGTNYKNKELKFVKKKVYIYHHITTVLNQDNESAVLSIITVARFIPFIICIVVR